MYSFRLKPSKCWVRIGVHFKILSWRATMKVILMKICLKGGLLKCNIVERANRLAFLNDLCLNKVVTVDVGVNLFYELLMQASLRFNTVCKFLITY